MLQTDLFFSYGLSAGLALAARKKLKSEPNPLVNKYFLATLLWLALGFIPQIQYLQGRFPAWESMFVASSASDYPPWFMSLYSMSIIIMGTLGFYFTFILIKKGKVSAAVAQLMGSVAIALLLATVGWDGAGYQRVLYPGTGADWAKGVAFPVQVFFTSPVFISLLWLEALLLIPYSVLFISWAREP